MNKGDLMEPKIVLFGTGKMLPCFEEMLNSANTEFYCYADNNFQKWGTFIREKKVIPPSEIAEFDNRIILSCGDESAKQIEKQLESMGLKGRIISPYDYIKRGLDNSLPDFEYLKQINVRKSGKRKVIIDALYGVGWGGMEAWSYAIAEGLSSRGYDAEVIGSTNQVKQPERFEKLIKRYTYENRTYREVINELVKDLSEKMPLVLINNMSGHVLFACYILKSLFPDYVKIVSVSHSDIDFIYKRQVFWQDYFDGIVCVSRDIQKKFDGQYGVKKEKLHYKETFIDFDKYFKKKYSKAGESIRIGYASRLERLNKRADLIPKLIEKLEEQNIKYVFEIVGDGSCFDLINSYVHEHRMESRVNMLGYFERDKLREFWKRQDIYVNFSEYEGTSLSMLEAMSYGVVPVVTDVSGVNDFIENRVNGCVSKVDDLDDMAENIKYLYDNREKLAEYGNICREEIRTRCRKSDYIDYIADLCGLN